MRSPSWGDSRGTILAGFIACKNPHKADICYHDQFDPMLASARPSFLLALHSCDSEPVNVKACYTEVIGATAFFLDH